MNKEFSEVVKFMDASKVDEVLSVIHKNYENQLNSEDDNSINLEKLILTSSYFSALELLRKYHEWYTQSEQ